MNNIRVLDCTLRDGGYINDWQFGKNTIKNIISNLVEAGTDLIEVGFLRNCEYDNNCTCYNSISEIKKILPDTDGKSEYVAMALYTNYDVNKLEECDGTIKYIRITFHNYDIDQGLEYCRKVKNKGYKIFVNPINLMGYSDIELLHLIDKVNTLSPYGFSIVDTFGSMTQADLIRIYALIENNLDKKIVLGIHLHENMAMGFSLAQTFLDIKSPLRYCVIDGSLYGMGRQPGNLCIELAMDYINKKYGYNYQLESILDAIENYIVPIKNMESWGYSTEYFLSAKYNLHRNYAEYYQKKGRLTSKAINKILSQIPIEKKSAFDEDYAEQQYRKYISCDVDDKDAISLLIEKFQKKKILVIAPGKSIDSNMELINSYRKKTEYIVVTANFYSDEIIPDFAFFSNLKRYDEYKQEMCGAKLIVTSNLVQEEIIEGYTVNFSRLANQNGGFTDSCGILLLRLLSELNVDKIVMAGFDGFSDKMVNFYKGHFGEFAKGKLDAAYNMVDEINALKNDIDIEFATSSIYEGDL
jgi:4-hydroxy 2-oxovalerate aldolase